MKKDIPYDLYIYLNHLTKLLTTKSTNSNEQILSNVFTSIELSTRLILSIFSSNRSLFNKNNLIEQLLSDINQQLELLQQFDLKDNYNQNNNFQNYSIPQSNINNLFLLNKNLSNTNYIDQITTTYFKICSNMNCEIGLGNIMNKLRQAFNLNIIQENYLNFYSYNSLVEYENILALQPAEYFNSEDELFMSVHQITECWFFIIINQLNKLLYTFENEHIIDNCYEVLFNVSKILDYVSSHNLLLEHMVLSDYHPLRVALRGASGGQSQQAYQMFNLAKQVFSKFLDTLNKNNTNIIYVLRQPKIDNHSIFNKHIQGFSRFERALKNFFFQHYVLSSSVIGSQSFGSIGQELSFLTKKFTQPIFKEIDEAKYDFTMQTNFKYASFAGNIILSKENFKPNNTIIVDIKPALIQQVIHNYFLAISNLNSESWVQLFSENGYIEDPIGSRPYIGHSELAIFFKGIIRMFTKFNMDIESQNINNNCAVIKWKAIANTYNNKQVKFHGVETFYISEQLKIMSAQVEWNPSSISAQLEEQKIVSFV